jgi:O-antigen ligase
MPERTLGIGAPNWRSTLWTWLGRLAFAALIVAFAVLAGSQIANTDKRVVQVVAAGLVVYLTFRSQLISGLMLAILFLPFPKGTSYGSTNIPFMMLIFIVWVFRVRTGRAKPAERTPLDLPILGLIMAYGLSFYNVARPEDLPLAWGQFARFLTYVFLLYLVVNIVRSTADVKKVFLAQCLSCFLVCLCALYEQIHPGAAIVRGWIDFQSTQNTLGSTHNVRVGSTFLDYELFGEYCALNFVLQMFMFQHASTRSRRWAFVGLMLLTFYCLLATVTRGAIITFVAGLIYLAWLSRKRLNFVKLTGAVALVVGLIGGGDFMVSNFTHSNSVLARLFASKLENGIPDSRVPAWKLVWEKVMQSPIIGHGPYYSIEKGVGLEWWPHNVYLYYAYITGFVGLFFFLWILRQLWIRSRPLAASFGTGTYIESATVLVRVLLFMFMLDQTKIDYLRNGTYSFFAWFLFGLILAVSGVARSEATATVAVEGRPAAETLRTPARALGAPRLGVSSVPAVPPR